MPDFTETELWALCATAEGRYKKETRLERTDNEMAECVGTPLRVQSDREREKAKTNTNNAGGEHPKPPADFKYHRVKTSPYG